MAKATVSLAGRDILDLESFNVEEINLVLQTAAEMKKIMKRDIKKVPSLRGKSIINLFYEPSTRTRTSFELAGKYLGGGRGQHYDFYFQRGKGRVPAGHHSHRAVHVLRRHRHAPSH